MSDNRQLVSDIQKLDKGLTDCENFLAKVLNRKIEGSRQAPTNKKKNVPAKSFSRSQSRSRGVQPTHQRAPSASSSGVKDIARKSSPVVHSQPKKVSSDQPPKPKTSDGQRKRSNSVTRPSSQSCTCEPPNPATYNKLPLHVHVPRLTSAQLSQVQVPTKLEPLHATRSRSPGSRNKNLSWGEVLRENHQTACVVDRGKWDIGRVQISGSRQSSSSQPSFSSKNPHECEPVKECSSSECTAASCNHFFQVSVQRRSQEESFSSEGTSGFSSNNDLPSHLMNKGVQCGSPLPDQEPKSCMPDHYKYRRVSSTSSGASSQKAEEKVKVIGSDVFSIFDPVRTLNFLIKELQGLLQKNPKEDDSICRVIADMEKVLHRLPESGAPTESTSGYTTHSKPHDSHSITSASTRSHDTTEKFMDCETQNVAILKALQTVPALAQRIDERTESLRKKIVEAKTHIPAPAFTPAPQETYTNSVDNILRLQSTVENSGHQLEIMCQTMEQTCEVLRNERDSLRGGVEERDKKLRIAKSQEQDFVTTVTSLRTNLESTTRRVTQLSVENKVLKEQLKDLPILRACEFQCIVLSKKVDKLEEENKEIQGLKYIEEKYKQLSTENTRLKEENEIIPALRNHEAKVADLTSDLAKLETEKKNLEDMVSRSNQEIQRLKETSQNQVGVAEATKRLTQRLQETMKERDEAQHDAQMLRIEREKLLVLQQNKEEELGHFVQDIVNIKKMVTSQLNILKTNVPVMTPPPSISDVLNSSSESEEFTSTSQCQPLCSSPTSITSGLAPVDDVWQDISTIVPEQTHSSPEILMTTNRKKEETESPTNFKSIGRDTWHSTHPTGQGEACIPEDDPPRPHTAVPGPRPPVDCIAAAHGDSQWMGAAAVTHELHQNVQELFKLINNKPNTSSSDEPLSSARTVVTATSSLASSRHPPMSVQSARGTNRNFQFQMPQLPDPPKFLETPEFSDFSSYHGSLAETSSVESIDAVLKELQKGDNN